MRRGLHGVSISLLLLALSSPSWLGSAMPRRPPQGRLRVRRFAASDELRGWVQSFILEGRFCPWATRSMAAGELRFVESAATSPEEAAGSLIEQALRLDLATRELASSLLILRHVEAFQEFFIFDAYLKAWDRGLVAPKGTRSGVLLPRAKAPSERTQELLKRCHEKVRLVTFHPGFSRWLEPPGGYCNSSQVFLDLMQKRVHVDPHFAGEPATIFRPGPEEVEVGPRQVCARLHGGSGICAWDLEDIVPEEDFVPLPDNDMHRTPFPVVHLIRKVDLSGDSIIADTFLLNFGLAPHTERNQIWNLIPSMPIGSRRQTNCDA
ncbi:Dynlt1 [Symbiodinium sp. CCMP2456]|nr:Dynlt1 [Symbiodinium sp. CCMP2456]